ncbi:MAG: 50S ribosomal protein L6, partial [Kiritimatiellales bacterium]|nr:50S ribosomal protein L6 [Kiritimatiellales bacterium]
MSRIGKQPISIPSGVTVAVAGQTVTVKGSKGESSYTAPSCVSVNVEGNSVEVARTDASKMGVAMFGT